MTSINPSSRLSKIRFITMFIAMCIVIGPVSACSGKSAETTPFVPATTVPVTTATPTETVIPVTEPIETEPAATTSSSTGFLLNPFTGIADMDPENAGMRSVAIVVNNHIASIPQRGLHKADVIYEYETEGGQTRLLALFADVSSVPEIGSIRSARVVSSHLAAGTNSLFIHFGSNARVPSELKQYGIQDIDGNAMCASSGHSVKGDITLPSNLFFYRDDNWKSKRAIEHTAVTNGKLLLGAIEYKGFDMNGETPVLFHFVESPSPSLANGQTCTDLNIFFSLTNKDSNFIYDKEIAMYGKYQYNGKAQIDELTQEMIYVKNVFVLFARIEPHGDSTIDAYLNEGGAGFYVSEGKLIEITWEKDTPNNLIEVFDKEGNPVEVNVGKSYINIVRRSRSTQTTWE